MTLLAATINAIPADFNLMGNSLFPNTFALSNPNTFIFESSFKINQNPCTKGLDAALVLMSSTDKEAMCSVDNEYINYLRGMEGNECEQEEGNTYVKFIINAIDLQCAKDENNQYCDINFEDLTKVEMAKTLCKKENKCDEVALRIIQDISTYKPFDTKIHDSINDSDYNINLKSNITPEVVEAYKCEVKANQSSEVDSQSGSVVRQSIGFSIVLLYFLQLLF